MAQILVIADDRSTVSTTEHVLRLAGHSVLSVQSAADGLRLFNSALPAVVVTGLRRSNVTNLDVLRALRRACSRVPVIVVTRHGDVRDAVEATRDGAADVVQEPVGDEITGAVTRAIGAQGDRREVPADGCEVVECEAHAAARWAGCVVRIVDSPKDPRTLVGWSRWIIASEGALRNWCYAAGISPRRSLVFGRMLRAVCRSDNGRHAPRNLVDVVDRRTLTSLLRYAGFRDEHSFPHAIPEFLSRQQLVRDPDMLVEIDKALVRSMLLPADSATAAADEHLSALLPPPDESGRVRHSCR